MKCPGQDTRYWDSGAIFEIKCPSCGHTEEFFKDESTRKCKKCGFTIRNPKMDFGCAAYCKFADQCIGELSEEMKQELLKNRVAVEMRSYFGDDTKRIEHANRVADYAEKIAKELNADLAVVLIAAYLHDIGIKEAENKYNSTASKFQEELGPGIAREILTKLNAGAKLIDEVCDIIGHHHSPREHESENFKAVYDADQIINILENKNKLTKDEIIQAIKLNFLTHYGRGLAENIFFNPA